MPQMMPINWMISLLFFIIIFILFNIINYYIFNYNYTPKKMSKNLIFNSSIFFWKW